MAQRKILIYGDPILRETAKPVEEITPEIQQLSYDMIETMRANEGIGLSGNQVGALWRILTIDMTLFDEDLLPITMLNVAITDRQGKQVDEEGCLSLPAIREDVERDDQISITFMTIDGEFHDMTCAGVLSRVIQHELDHLDGIMFIDKIGPFKRNLLAKRLRRLAKGEAVS